MFSWIHDLLILQPTDGRHATTYENDDVLPLNPARRTWGLWQFACFWSINNLVPTTFMAGSSLIGTGLSVRQAMIAVFVSPANKVDWIRLTGTDCQTHHCCCGRSQWLRGCAMAHSIPSHQPLRLGRLRQLLDCLSANHTSMSVDGLSILDRWSLRLRSLVVNLPGLSSNAKFHAKENSHGDQAIPRVDHIQRDQLLSTLDSPGKVPTIVLRGAKHISRGYDWNYELYGLKGSWSGSTFI